MIYANLHRVRLHSTRIKNSVRERVCIHVSCPLKVRLRQKCGFLECHVNAASETLQPQADLQPRGTILGDSGSPAPQLSPPPAPELCRAHLNANGGELPPG